jgi:phenylalanyl-tRNA synthetase beta chain
MNISLNWLNQHIDLSGKTIQELDDLLTFAGIEIEGIHAKGITSEKVVVAQIMEAVQHPNADRLKVTQIDAGEGFLRQIVCGAQNYKVGDKVPCALPGASLPAGFTIGETKMRGVDSKGMLCAASEIGLTNKEDGLLILENNLIVGTPVKTLFESDVLLEVEVTPNRPDLLSHRGLAFELTALLKMQLKPLKISDLVTEKNSNLVNIEDQSKCAFYSITKISNVKIDESPDWLKERILSIGLKPINNIVDITNFVMHDLGQPLHAFDAAKVGKKIHVRNAKPNESFHALNDQSYELNQKDLVISDENGTTLALAGVMGGLASSVTNDTTEILLEAAYFDPSMVRATARSLILSSDSSYRFERGINPKGILSAASHAIKLILEITSGREKKTITAGSPPEVTGIVELNIERMNQLMGHSISVTDAENILTRLGLISPGENRWQVPSSRADLQRHIDLVEEIARVYGLANVPSRLRATFSESSEIDKAADLDMTIRRSLAAIGFYEAQTIKLISEKQMLDALTLRPLQDGDVIKVSSPLSEDHSIMRPSLLPGLVATAERNVRQGLKSLRFFEMGRVFRHSGGGKARDQESDSIALFLSGSLRPDSWADDSPIATIYDLKAVIISIASGQTVQFFPREREEFVLTNDIFINGQNIGIAARLKPSRERELNISSPVWVAEIDLSKLRKINGRDKVVEALPQFPQSTRDAAMEVDIKLPAADIDKVILKTNEPLLVHFECFDIFSDSTGLKIAADRKSIAYRFTYRAADKTLKTEEIDQAHQKILEDLTNNLAVKFR